MKVTSFFAALGILLTISTSFGSTVERTTVKTPRGAEVNVQVNIPANISSKTPAVVIAPGQGYSMNLPIIKGLAESLASKGIIAFRFDWNYYSTDPKNGNPSPDLSNEVQDMQTVVNLAKADTRVDVSQLLLAGKSLGSVVSYEVFAKDTSAKAIVLLTPLCTSAYDDNGNPLPAPIAVAQQDYVGLVQQTRPIVMVLGNNDPNCSLPMLYDFLKDTKGNVSSVVIGGDHSWDVSNGTDATSKKLNSVNIASGMKMATHWINLLLGR